VIAADAGHFRPAFVETSFGAQGQTVDRVILGMSLASRGAMNMEQLYVSASRARDWLRLYTDDRDEVRAAVQRSSQKLAALDLAPEAGRKQAVPREQLQEERDRRERLAWLKRRRRTSPPPMPPETPRPLPATHGDRYESIEPRRRFHHGR